MSRLVSGVGGLLLLAGAASAATVTVNDAGDSTNACAASGTGTCTLRDALTFANANAGSTIAFSIPGTGIHTIAPAAPYPSISATVTIDGFTQPGSSPNSNGPGLGDDSLHLIEIDGTHSGNLSLTAALAFGAGSNGSVIRGLVDQPLPEQRRSRWRTARRSEPSSRVISSVPIRPAWSPAPTRSTSCSTSASPT